MKRLIAAVLTLTFVAGLIPVKTQAGTYPMTVAQASSEQILQQDLQSIQTQRDLAEKKEFKQIKKEKESAINKEIKEMKKRHAAEMKQFKKEKRAAMNEEMLQLEKSLQAPTVQ